MSRFQSISLENLIREVNEGVSKMNADQKAIWEIVAILPEKWNKQKYRGPSGGFWVVAIFGKQVIWYNDIEEGFNISNFTHYGMLDESGVEQDELQWTINKMNAPQQNLKTTKSGI